ncbi:MAG: TatD family hydrolase [Clostridia bacterium]|nr:TatD family hydrolase [Clostridia bacterium]
MEYPLLSRLTERAIFDSHAHYNDEKFDGCREELFAELPHQGVLAAVNCGCDLPSSQSAVTMAEQYDYLYAAVGIHPEFWQKGDEETLSQLEQMAQHPKCVAIGEIGLDYYWDKEHRAEQILVFEKQILLAKKLGKPVLVHDRDAHADTLNLLKKHQPDGVLHCFSGSPEMAAEVLKFGMYLGIGGVITFKNARKLPEVVTMIPDDRLLLETDCPYLAPEPYRGKLCHSGLILLTAERVAELRHQSVEHVLSVSARNAEKMFQL